jgi:hypothetical protein
MRGCSERVASDRRIKVNVYTPNYHFLKLRDVYVNVKQLSQWIQRVNVANNVTLYLHMQCHLRGRHARSHCQIASLA